MGVLYLAKKYMVPSLAEKCAKYLEDHLDPSNVFSVLPSAQKYEEKKLLDRCWEVIDKQTEAAAKSDGFATIERSLLEAIVERHTLSIAEIELFKAVELWATKECQRQGLVESDGKVKRRILREKIVKGIRFPTMTQEEFAGVVLDSGILMTEEIIQIIKYFNSALTSPVGFAEIKRCGSLSVQRCCSFNSVVQWDSGLATHAPCINFSVNKDILLHGLCIFGIENSTVNAHVAVNESARKLVSKSGQFWSKLCTLKLFSYYGFTVMFDAPIVIKKNTVHHLQAKIISPIGKKMVCGDIGMRSVTCAGVTFIFTDCFEKDGMNFERRQFPELLFSL